MVFRKVDAKSNENASERIKVLNDLLNGEQLFVVTTIQALAQKTVNISEFKNSMIEIKTGDIIPIEDFSSKLASIGYKREANVESHGQFSVRGGILDVFPYNSDTPYRIEFWDEEVDTIKLFDEETQLSTESISKVKIPPVKDSFGDCSSTLCDYFNNYLAFYDEPHRIEEYYNVFLKEFSDNLLDSLERSTKKDATTKVYHYLQTYDEITKSISPNSLIGLSNLATSSKGLKPKEIFSLTSKSMPTYNGNLALICDV